MPSTIISAGPGRPQLARRQLEPPDRGRAREIEVPVSQLEARSPDLAELLGEIGLAVAVGVAQPIDGALRARLSGCCRRTSARNHVDIAVAIDDDVARFPHAGVHDEGTEPRWQGEPAIIAIARRQSPLTGNGRRTSKGEAGNPDGKHCSVHDAPLIR
jgi:hypothetical protein